VSRELHPKPFIRLSDGQSLLQKAFLRAAAQHGVAEVLTVTNRELFFKTRDEYREVDDKVATSYVLEPFGRGTAAAVACAALRAAQVHGEGTILLILPADHLIEKAEAFAAAVSRAAALAGEGRLVTFGIKPTSPETGYGYIEANGEQVLRFVEKPPLEKAREYLSSWRFFWNSGMFCFSAAAVIEEMTRHCPDILQGARECLERSAAASGKDFAQLELEASSFAAVREDSIDYALMEKSSRVSVVACDIGWSDIGSWTAIGALAPRDDAGNRIEAQTVLHDVTGTYIRSEDRLVGVVGVSDLVIVDTPDALLVASAARAQDVKHLYARLKEKGHEAHKLHRTVHRPWGTYTVLEEGPGFKIKRIAVKPGASLSLQMHKHRSEHWIVVSGTARVVNGDRELTVDMNESTFIPAGNRHRLANPGSVDLVIIEVQSGKYLGEDDIVRFDDQYGRVRAVHG
jgi:mannose-1-phosphate guanylyltransferase